MTPAIPPAKAPTKGERLERRNEPATSRTWSNWTDVPAWVVSLAFHTVLFLLLAWLWRPITSGTGGTPDRPIGIAMVHQSQNGETFSLDHSQASGSPSASGASGSPSANAPIDLEALVGSLQGGSDSDGTGEVLDSATSGDGKVGTVPGSKSRTGMTQSRFYGLEGQGNSFVYVIDRSDSMNEFNSAPWRAARKELSTSLESLVDTNQFQIIFYNEAPILYRSRVTGSAGLIRAQKVEREQATRFVQQVVATGGTEHLSALKLALRLQPDVLFFLTDAADPRMNSDQLQGLVVRCESIGTTIHSVEFGSGPEPGESRWIEALAKRTGGQYRYVDTTLLGR